MYFLAIQKAARTFSWLLPANVGSMFNGWAKLFPSWTDSIVSVPESLFQQYGSGTYSWPSEATCFPVHVGLTTAGKYCMCTVVQMFCTVVQMFCTIWTETKYYVQVTRIFNSIVATSVSSSSSTTATSTTATTTATIVIIYYYWENNNSNINKQ